MFSKRLAILAIIGGLGGALLGFQELANGFTLDSGNTDQVNLNTLKFDSGKSSDITVNSLFLLDNSENEKEDEKSTFDTKTEEKDVSNFSILNFNQKSTETVTATVDVSENFAKTEVTDINILEQKKEDEKQDQDEGREDSLLIKTTPITITPIKVEPVEPIKNIDEDTKQNELPKKEDPKVISEQIETKISEEEKPADATGSGAVKEEKKSIFNIFSPKVDKVDIEVESKKDAKKVEVKTLPEIKDTRLQVDFEIEKKEDGSVKVEGSKVRTNLEIAIDSKVKESNKEDAPKEEQVKPKILSPIKPTLIKTKQDLGTYAGDIAARDTDVESVEIEEDTVEVSYKKPARLFGIFPTKIKEDVVVKTDSLGRPDVEVKRPWWAIFTSEKDSKEEVAEDIEKRVGYTGTGASSQESSVRLAGILGAIDRTMKIGSDKATGIDVVSSVEEGLPDRDDVPEEGVLVSDLDVMMRQAFLGDLFNRPGSGSSAHIFIDLAIEGTFGNFASQQLSIASRTAGDSGEFIVAGIGRVLTMFNERGLSHQHDAFLRSALVLEVARAMNGDAAAAAFVNQYASQMNNLLANSGVPLTTSANGNRTLVNFAVCSGANRAGCVDVATLLSSLGDPRSLSNLCDPGNMVLNGIMNLAGDERYGCAPPTGMCATTLEGGINNGENVAPGLPGIQQPENALGQSDVPNGAQGFLEDQGITGQDLETICGAHAAGALGLGGGTQECIENAISQMARQDLLGAAGMAGCMAGALGLELGDDPAIDRVIDDALNSRGCGDLAADGEKKETPPKEEKKPDPSKETEEKTPPPKDKEEPKKEEKGFFGKLWDAVFGGGNDKKPGVEFQYDKEGKLIGAESGNTIVRLNEDGEAIVEIGGQNVTVEGSQNELEAILDAIGGVYDGEGVGNIVDYDSTGEIYIGAQRALLKFKNIRGSSLEPSSGCSEALQALEAAYTQCSGDIINNAAAGAGVPGGSPAERIGRTAPGSNPFGGRPGEYGGTAGATDPITACMEANSSRTHGSGNWASNGGACGFMVCADGTDSCCQGAGFGNQAAGELLRDLRDCTEVMCVPGEPCLCAGEQSTGELPEIPIFGDDGGVNPVANDSIAPNEGSSARGFSETVGNTNFTGSVGTGFGVGSGSNPSQELDGDVNSR